MDQAPLDTLLDRLNDGDLSAAEQVYRSYEPYLRMVVRRRMSAALRVKFDSADIVQSVWADVLDGLGKSKWRFDDAAQLRAFMVTMTRNRFVDRLRQHRRSLAMEVPLPGGDVADDEKRRAIRVSEAFYADELWTQMLEACPPAHRELLHLKRQGASLAEIAERTGLHQGSVRRILYDLARRVARLRVAAARCSSQ